MNNRLMCATSRLLVQYETMQITAIGKTRESMAENTPIRFQKSMDFIMIVEIPPQHIIKKKNKKTEPNSLIRNELIDLPIFI